MSRALQEDRVFKLKGGKKRNKHAKLLILIIIIFFKKTWVFVEDEDILRMACTRLE